MGTDRDRGVQQESIASYNECTGFSGASYPVRSFSAVRATAGGAAVRDDMQAQQLAGDPK